MIDLVSRIDDSYAKGVHHSNAKRDTLRWMGFIECNVALVCDLPLGKRILGVYYSSIDEVDPIETALTMQGMLPASKYVGINYKGMNLFREMKRRCIPPSKEKRYDRCFDTILLSLASENPLNGAYIQALSDVLWYDGILVASRSMKNHEKVKSPEIEEKKFRAAGLEVEDGFKIKLPVSSQDGSDQRIKVFVVTSSNGRPGHEREKYNCTHVYRFYSKAV